MGWTSEHAKLFRLAKFDVPLAEMNSHYLAHVNRSAFLRKLMATSREVFDRPPQE